MKFHNFNEVLALSNKGDVSFRANELGTLMRSLGQYPAYEFSMLNSLDKGV